MTAPAAGKKQISAWLTEDACRWLRVTAAERGITRSQVIEELIKKEQAEQQ